MTDFWLDLRHALRVLRRRPATAFLIVTILALGIAANATVYSSFHAVHLRALPFQEPDRLVMVYGADRVRGKSRGGMSPPELADVAARPVIDQAGAFFLRTFDLDGADRADRVRGSQVTPSLLRILGVTPRLGRVFDETDAEVGASPVVLLGHALWRRHFDGDPEVVGKRVRIDGVSHTVVGVMPERFGFPLWEEVWTPLDLEGRTSARDDRFLTVVARLAAGTSPSQAQLALDGLAADWRAAYPDTNERYDLDVRPLRDFWLPPQAKVVTRAQLGAVLFVLLVVCANLANLLLAMATERRHETALRAALGAPRGRLVRASVTESGILAAVGGALGLLLTPWGVDWMHGTIPVRLPTWIVFEVNGAVLGYVLGLTVFTALAVGLVPAWRTTGRRSLGSLGRGGRSAPREDHRLRQLLVVGELALSLVLVVGALTMVQGVVRLHQADRGYRSENVVAGRVSLGSEGYRDAAERRRFITETLRGLASEPGIRAVGATDHLPANGDGFELRYRPVRLAIDGRPYIREHAPDANLAVVSPGYFEALGIPLLAGRLFLPEEVEGEVLPAATLPVTTLPVTRDENVALVNARLAARLWPDRDPVGQRLRVAERSPSTWRRVVGVVGDVERGYRLYAGRRVPVDQVYVPLADQVADTMTLVAWHTGAPTAAAQALRGAVQIVDPAVPVFELDTLGGLLAKVEWIPRWMSQVFSFLAVLALVIAALGAYGVNAYAVGQRTQEIGIRQALGARPGDVARMVVRQALSLAVLAVALGVVVAVPVASVLNRALYATDAVEPWVLAGVALLLVAVAWLASVVPARRAAAVDPLVALRED